MRKLRTKTPVWIAVVMLFCLGAQSASAATLRLISLQCFNTEDSEVDESRLVITGEGQTTRYRRNMSRGELWILNRQVHFRNQQTVRLFDLDEGPFDHDDLLGRLVVGSQPTNGIRIRVFNRDGAHYVLRYRVD